MPVKERYVTIAQHCQAWWVSIQNAWPALLPTTWIAQDFYKTLPQQIRIPPKKVSLTTPKVSIEKNRKNVESSKQGLLVIPKVSIKTISKKPGKPKLWFGKSQKKTPKNTKPSSSPSVVQSTLAVAFWRCSRRWCRRWRGGCTGAGVAGGLHLDPRFPWWLRGLLGAWSDFFRW